MRDIDLTRSREFVLDRMQNRRSCKTNRVMRSGLINENHIKGVTTGYTGASV